MEAGSIVPQFFTTLVSFLYQFVLLVGLLVDFLLNWWVVIAWLAWSLLGINWKRAWPILARGAWAPAVLLVLTAALAWSQLAPAEGAFLGVGTIPNFWWQLGDVSLLAAVTLFCGWLQGVLGWAPAEIDLEPPAVAPAHGHH
jgi:hypothetical protein